MAKTEVRVREGEWKRVESPVLGPNAFDPVLIRTDAFVLFKELT